MNDQSGSQDYLIAHLSALAKRNWVLDLHVDPQDLVRNEAYIRALPIVTIIDHIAHVRGADCLFQPAFPLLLELLRDEQIWVKIVVWIRSAASKRRRSQDVCPIWTWCIFAKADFEVAPDRVLWGSDWPNSNILTPGQTPNIGDLLDLLSVIAPNEATRRRILVDNPARLFGFLPL